MLFPIAKGEKYGSNWKTPGVRGGFGADRKGRPHAGCDIGAKDGVRVVAIDSGIVVERGNKPFIRNTNLFAIAVKHAGGIVARYTEIDEIPAHLAKGVKVKAGEMLGRVAFQGKGSMLHFELYRGDRSGTLSVPWAIWPRIGTARKKPGQLSEAEKSRIRTAGYLWDFMRRDDLVDPTEFLIKLEKGEPPGDGKAALIAIGLGILVNPAAALAYAAAYATGQSGTPLPSAESIEDSTRSRAYEGVTGVAFEGPTVTTTQPEGGHPRDYWGPTDMAMPEPD